MNTIATIKSTELREINTANDLYKSWLDYVSYGTGSNNTTATYDKAMRQFMKYLAENNIRQPQRKDIADYVEHLKATGHKATTIQNYLRAVKLFFKWTAEEGKYPNVAQRVKGVKIDREHKRDYLTTNQVKELVNTAEKDTSIKGLRDTAIIKLMLTTALRTISVAEANIEDLKIKGDSLVLYYKGKGHSEKATYVKIAPPVEKAIREYLEARGTAKTTEPLFASVSNHKGDSNKMTTRSISRICKNNLVGAGLNSDRLTAHSFRHTAITHNLLNGGTLEETQQLANHANIQTTLIYSHAIERDNNQSELRIAEALLG